MTALQFERAKDNTFEMKRITEILELITNEKNLGATFNSDQKRVLVKYCLPLLKRQIVVLQEEFDNI